MRKLQGAGFLRASRICVVECEMCDVCAGCYGRVRGGYEDGPAWIRCPSAAYPRLRIWDENGERMREIVEMEGVGKDIVEVEGPSWVDRTMNTHFEWRTRKRRVLGRGAY